MFEIVEKRELAENIYLTRVKAPRIANSAKPGQFVIVRVKEGGERIPLTIADYDVEAGTVTIVTQTIGMSTRKICALEVGEYLADFANNTLPKLRRYYKEFYEFLIKSYPNIDSCIERLYLYMKCLDL